MINIDQLDTQTTVCLIALAAVWLLLVYKLGLGYRIKQHHAHVQPAPALSSSQELAIRCAYEDLCGSLTARVRQDFSVHEWDLQLATLADMEHIFAGLDLKRPAELQLVRFLPSKQATVKDIRDVVARSESCPSTN